MNRTLPVSLSGAVLGIALSAADYRVDWKVAVLLVLTVVFLHFCSYFSKAETEKLYSRVFLALTIASGLAMLYFSFGSLLLIKKRAGYGS